MGWDPYYGVGPPYGGPTVTIATHYVRTILTLKFVEKIM